MHFGLLAALLLLAPTEDPAPVEGSSDAPIAIDLPDSVTTVYTSSREQPLRMEVKEVRARRVLRERGADRVEIGAGLLRSRDGAAVSDLAPLLPSTHLGVNSRGEALFMVRGSSERHLAVSLDGIALTVPWDERADLSMIPLTAVGEVDAQRGVASVLDPINSLAGAVRMRTLHREQPGSRTQLGLSHGEVSAWNAHLRHERRDGAWTTLLAAEHRSRDGFLLPEDTNLQFNQPPSRRTRTNSDLEQNAFLLRLGRDLPRDGAIGLLVQGSDGEKGVPPETHLDGTDPATDDPRYWRYPELRRLLVGLTGKGHLDAARRWRWNAGASFDAFSQDIREFDDLGYDSPDLTPGVDFEEDRDRTWSGHARVTHPVGDRWEWALRGTARHAHHRESLVVGDPELEYVQRLMGAAAEARFAPTPHWSLRAGAGWESAQTPETGDKPAREADHEPVLQASVQHDFDGGDRVHLGWARRSRFPSLREMFSGALGRFVVNPELRPERQNSLELGWSRRTSRGDFGANLFGQWLDGAIERVSLPGGGRQRRNLDEVRNLGVELGALVRPARGLSVDWQFTLLHSRSLVAGSWDGRVEDRPDWLSTLGLAYTHPRGAQLRVEAVGVGPRWSLDTSPDAPESGLSELDADLRVNLRVSWRHFGRGTTYAGTEVFLRLDNVFDAETESQLGLPESGRTLRVGTKVDLGV